MNATDLQMLFSGLLDFWPAYVCLYYAAGLMLAARILYLDTVDNLGHEPIRRAGWSVVACVFAMAALWPALVGLFGLGRYAVRRERRRLRRVAECR